MPRPRSTVLALLAACLALAGIPRPAAAFTPAEAKAPMTVTLVRGDAADCGADCPEWLALTGLIGAGTPALFSAALARLGGRNVPVLVDSPGGAVQPAMAIGRLVRARGMTVAVAGTGLDDCAPVDRACAAGRRAGVRPGFVAGGIAACASACVLILAAGTERSVGQNSAVGVHQMVVHQTLTRVINTFRILRRMVNGRPVEVSRTLIRTRPVSSREVQRAAPETMYSEVDRYLLGLGVAESIMPLMRSAPPNGIHWMTPSELAATRIATDTTDARTLVARSAPKGSPAPGGRMALAGLLIDGARLDGIVDWRVDGEALVGTVDVEGRHLHGTLTFRRDTTPGAAAAFTASERFADAGPGAAANPATAARWTGEAPRFCDEASCSSPFTVATHDGAAGTRDFDVLGRWNDLFLSALRSRDHVVVDVADAEGRHGRLRLPLSGDARAVVDGWERRCCGLAPSSASISGALRATLVSASTPDAGPSPEDGTVMWRLDAAAAGDPATLVGDVDLPNLKASVRLTFAASASGPAALTIVLRPAPGANGRAAAVAAGPPGFRDGRTGGDRPMEASLSRPGAATTVVVPASERRTAVEGFHDRPWFALPVRIEGRKPVVLLLNLNGGGRPAIEAWLARDAGEETGDGA